MNVRRIVSHLLWADFRLGKAFPPKSLATIEHAIRVSESRHLGEIRFAVEGGLDGPPLFKGLSARERAVDLFSQLRVWDTEHNTGLLIYLLLADHAVEIVADRGIAAKVSAGEWQQVCRQMESAFARADFEGGVVAGVQSVTEHLIRHFPGDGRDANELPDKPVLL